MSSESPPRTARRITQGLLLLLAAGLIGYALSDHPFYGGDPGFGKVQVLILVGGIGLGIAALLPLYWSGRVLLVAVSALIALAVAELAGEILLSARYRPVYQPDDRLIFKLVPNSHSVMTRRPINGGEHVAHRINADGFRGEELRPVGSATRVVVYGDSFIHAFYCPAEETFAFQLAEELTPRLGGEVEVVNAGVSSYGPDQISLKMEHELPALRPDLVVVAVLAGNDYGDLLRNKLFKLREDGTLEENPYVLDEEIRRWMEFNQRESVLKRALRETLASMTPTPSHDEGVGELQRDPNVALMNFWLEEAKREYREYVIEGNDMVTNAQQDYYSADVSLLPNSDSARYRVRLMDAVLQRIRDVATRNEVPLVFLFIPHAIDVAEEYDWGRIEADRFPDYDRRNQIAPLEEMARRHGVPFVSLFDIYRRHDANRLYFHGGNDHWNVDGQRMAAQVVADYVLAHGLLGGGGR